MRPPELTTDQRVSEYSTTWLETPYTRPGGLSQYWLNRSHRGPGLGFSDT